MSSKIAKNITNLFPFGENLTKWVSKEQLCCWKFCCCLFAQLCVTLCDPMNCSPPGSSVRGIFQATILEWVAISFSRGSSLHKEQTCILHCRWILCSWATREALQSFTSALKFCKIQVRGTIRNETFWIFPWCSSQPFYKDQHIDSNYLE